jgi:inosose dehydratase
MNPGSDTEVGRSGARIATAPVNWNNDDLTDWRTPVAFEELLRFMRHAGYTATEYGSNFPTTVEALRIALNRLDMSLCGAFQWLPLRDDVKLTDTLKQLSPKLALLQECGCHDLVIADMLVPERVQMAGQVPADGSASLDQQGFERIAAGAGRAAALASEAGIRVHYHNHVGTYVETPAEVDRLLPVLEPQGLDLCFDTGHYAYGGGNPAGFVAAHAPLIGYLHLKDVDGRMLAEAKERHWSFLEALRHIVFAPFGSGVVDIPGIIATLQQSEFAGWIVVEQDTCADDPTETARHNLDYLRTHTDLSI